MTSPSPTGFVETPDELAERIVSRTFILERLPWEGARVLLPGIGRGRFFDALERFCNRSEIAPPVDALEVVAVDRDPRRLREFARTHSDTVVKLHEADFLRRQVSFETVVSSPADVADLVADGGERSLSESMFRPDAPFDFILMNPPWVNYNDLPEVERERYVSVDDYTAATGRFNLYHLFIERALELLAIGGRLGVVAPRRWLFPWSDGSGLRSVVQRPEYHVEYIDDVADNAFEETVYPAITIIERLADDERAASELASYPTYFGDNLDSSPGNIRSWINGGAVKR